MADKTPIRGAYNGSSALTGLAEYATGDTVSVPFGGTGATSLTDNGILIGNAAAAVQATAALTTNGQVVVGGTSGPAVANIAGTTNEVEITNGDGTITVGLPSTISGLTNVSATNLTGTLATAAQTNITSVGTLSSLIVSGDVGIGTATPSGPLEVIMAAGTPVRISDPSASTTASEPQLGFYGSTDGATRLGYIGKGSTANNEFRIVNSQNDAMYFGTNDTERMRLDSTGNASMGGTVNTYSPSFGAANDVFFDIGGAGGGNVEFTRGADVNATWIGGLHWANTNNSSTSNDAGAIGIAHILGEIVTTDGNAGDDSGGSIVFYTKPEAAAAAEVVRIDSAGRVGIANTVPSTYGALNADSESLVLGTTLSPNSNITIASTITGNGRFAFTDTADNTNQAHLKYDHNTSVMSFHSNSADRILITSAGKVLISGFTNGAPSLELGVAGLSNALITAPEAMYFNIDSNNDQTDRRFWWGHNTNTTSATNLMTLHENGTLAVVGAVSKGSGSFRIRHPLESRDGYDLVHSFIEGPQADLLYRGVATLSGGTATVNIDTAARITDGTFVALVNNVQAFTTNETAFDNVRASVSGNVLTITSEDDTSTASISWLVVGERKDAHMLDTDWTDADGRVITEPETAVEPDSSFPEQEEAESEPAEAKVTALESA